MTRETVKQCKSCPWRVDCVPDRDIPNYVRSLHKGLDGTIAEPGDLRGLRATTLRVMACHYSKPSEEFPCAGWLYNQLGPGNNIAVRLRVMTGKMPAPEVDGPQHETFEETLCAPSDGQTTMESCTTSSLARATFGAPSSTSCAAAPPKTSATWPTPKTRRRASSASPTRSATRRGRKP